MNKKFIYLLIIFILAQITVSVTVMNKIKMRNKIKNKMKVSTQNKALNSMKMLAQNKIKLHMKNRMRAKGQLKHKIKSQTKDAMKSQLKDKSVMQINLMHKIQLKSLEQSKNQNQNKNNLKIKEKLAAKNQEKNKLQINTETYDFDSIKQPNESLEQNGLSQHEQKVLSDLMFRYKEYRPQNFYHLNHSDPFYGTILRENLFRNNTHFFDMPPSEVKKRDALAIKYGFPTSQEIERVEKGLDPFYVQRFPTQFENDFYRDYYINRCYKKVTKNHVEMQNRIKRDAFRFLQEELAYKPTPVGGGGVLEPESKNKDSQEDLSPCTVSIHNEYKKVELYECWASSRLDRLWRFDWWSWIDTHELQRKYMMGRDFAGYYYI